MRVLTLYLLLLLAGCNLFPIAPTPLPPVVIPSITPPPASPQDPRDYVPASFPDGIIDALPVMSGICFEAAFDAAGRLFVLKSAEEHIRLYDLADQSGLCSRPVRRYPFDFSAGMALAGLWSRGTGCTADHELLTLERDPAEIRLQLRFTTRGNCPYELVRPFWVGIPDAQNINIQIEVIESVHVDS